MTTPQEIEQKFWKALKSDMTVMLGIPDIEDGHARPMTVQIDEKNGPLWFFTAKDVTLVRSMSASNRAVIHFSSKGHDLFATVQGTLTQDNDRFMIERLWNPFVAAWFEGKDDPKLSLLRFDADEAEIWLNESSLLAGVKIFFGIDPKKDYADKVVQINLGQSATF